MFPHVEPLAMAAAPSPSTKRCRWTWLGGAVAKSSGALSLRIVSSWSPLPLCGDRMNALGEVIPNKASSLKRTARFRHEIKRKYGNTPDAAEFPDRKVVLDPFEWWANKRPARTILHFNKREDKRRELTRSSCLSDICNRLLLIATDDSGELTKTGARCRTVATQRLPLWCSKTSAKTWCRTDSWWWELTIE